MREKREKKYNKILYKNDDFFLCKKLSIEFHENKKKICAWAGNE